MIGQHVEHPQYGRGQITAIYRNGTEWLVRFESGLRFRRPRYEFNGEARQELPSPAAPLAYRPPPPMPRTQLQARHLVEALRVGVAPAQQIQELTIGLDVERQSLVDGLNQAHRQGGAVRAILGEYGFGKSHVVELTAAEALARNFLVAVTSLDLLELPPHRAFDIYSSLARNLRYPDNDERGLGPLLAPISASPRQIEQYQEPAPAPWDPLAVALHALHHTSSSRRQKAWLDWLMGGRRVRLMNKGMPRGVKFPSIYKIGHNARQMAYLLTALSALARQANYSGLCLLIDEAESYSLLRPVQRPKATLFFQAMIYAAMRHRQQRIAAADIPQHRWRDYPPAFDQGQSLFFLFTVTRSDNQMPLADWLEDDQILTLESHHTPLEIGHFMQQVAAYHAQAYSYEAGERQGQVRRAAAEHLALGMRNGRLSIRGVVRLSVELFDLLYLYPDFDAATLLEELRRQMRA
jgi:hypothetical protein